MHDEPVPAPNQDALLKRGLVSAAVPTAGDGAGPAPVVGRVMGEQDDEVVSVTREVRQAHEEAFVVTRRAP